MEPLECKQSQVSEQIDEALNATDRLKNIVSNLSDRLAGVVREPDPQETGGDGVEKQLVPIADRIRSIRYNIDNHVDQIREILYRLEV